ncbi:MAG: hypothetical protein KatS3mg035_1080 [Bacteroidia bacterium]|nr:MAG: hypothetical protein KatS3mg035_1080 [Bacteroidia bacterium]
MYGWYPNFKDRYYHSEDKAKDKFDSQDFDSFGITDGGESYRVVRIPIVENNYGDSGNPPVVNLSNDNARKLFGDLLGYEFDGGGFDMDAMDLVMKVDRFIEELLRRKDIPDRSYQTQDRNIINTVNGKEY